MLAATWSTSTDSKCETIRLSRNLRNFQFRGTGLKNPSVAAIPTYLGKVFTKNSHPVRPKRPCPPPLPTPSPPPGPASLALLPPFLPHPLPPPSHAPLTLPRLVYPLVAKAISQSLRARARLQAQREAHGQDFTASDSGQKLRAVNNGRLEIYHGRDFSSHWASREFEKRSSIMTVHKQSF